MIDLGVSKLALIAVVALVVIGPERLPKVARMVGNLFGRAQRYMADVKSEVNRQMEIEEFKKLREETTSAFKDVEDSINSTVKEASANLSDQADIFETSFEKLPRMNKKFCVKRSVKAEVVGAFDGRPDQFGLSAQPEFGRVCNLVPPE